MSSSNSSGYRLHSTQPVEIRVFDHSLQPVDRGIGRIERDGLPPGIYRVELRAGASSDEKLIKLNPGQIYEDLNLFLPFNSVVPLPSTRTFDQVHLSALQDLSVNMLDSVANETQLVVFIRVVTAEMDTKPDFKLADCEISLLDANLKKIAGLTERVRIDLTSGWCGVSAGLEAGGYLLRIESASITKPVDQALFLPRGWQTLVCVPVGESGPMPEASSIQTLPMGQGGFLQTLELNPDSALSLEVATTGLAAGRSLVPRQQIRELLNLKFWNPMLGIIGAYCMFDPTISSRDNPQSSKTATMFKFKSQEDAYLLKQVLDHLKVLMPGHPDLAALQEFYREAIGVDVDQPQPVAWPPTLNIGFKQLASIEELGREPFVPSSMADRACSWLTSCGPWTAWPSDKTTEDMPSPYSAQLLNVVSLSGGMSVPWSSLVGKIGRYVAEIAKTEDEPIDAIASKLTDEYLSSNTGLPISAVRAARLKLSGFKSLDKLKINSSINLKLK